MRAYRHEVASTGFDDFLQLTPESEGSGIRLPALAHVRYLVLLAVADLTAGDAVVGLRQFLELWAVQGSGETGALPPFYPFKLPVGGAGGDPFWHFIDGTTRWTLTFESTPPASHHYNPNESRSFAFEDSNTPALLFETVGFPFAPSEPGYLGLNAYTPPGMRGDPVLTMRDIRYPWQENSREELWWEAEGSRRARFYVEVFQTNARTRPFPTPIPTGTILGPEDTFTTITFPHTSYYGLVAGAIKIARRNCDQGRKRRREVDR